MDSGEDIGKAKAYAVAIQTSILQAATGFVQGMIMAEHEGIALDDYKNAVTVGGVTRGNVVAMDTVAMSPMGRQRVGM